MRRILIAVAIGVMVVGHACGGGGSAGNASDRREVDAGDAEPEEGEVASAANPELDAFISRAEKLENITFTATYRGADGREMKIAQADGKSRLESAGSVIIDDGKHSYICTSEPEEQCIQSDSAGEGNMTAGMLFSPGLVLAGLEFWQEIPGVDVQTSTRELAGLELECATLTAENQEPTTVCISDDGVLGYHEEGNTVIELLDFTTDIESDAFDPPYKVITEDDVTDPERPPSDDY